MRCKLGSGGKPDHQNSDPYQTQSALLSSYARRTFARSKHYALEVCPVSAPLSGSAATRQSRRWMLKPRRCRPASVMVLEKETEEKKCILVLGATGYLGQFLVQELAEVHKVGSVHHSTAEPKINGDVHHFWVDLSTGEGLQEALDTLGNIDVIVNCAAVSSPAACEKHPDHARSINVPTRLLDALDIHRLGDEVEPLLIHISTDQVYDGSRSYWREDDGCSPINAYGRTKREAEVLIQDRWPNHVILRPSVIFGPSPPLPVSRTLFLQFVERTLKAGKPAKFFSDEFRSPVFVTDIVRVVHELVRRTEAPQHRLFNLGGPERLSRVDMAEKVAKVWGYASTAIEPAPASSVQRDVASPADISMDIARIVSEFPGLRPTSMADALRQMRPLTKTQQELDS